MMSNGPQIFRIDPNSQKSEALKEVEFAKLGLKERADIQQWVSDNPGILGDDLLVIGEEFSDFEGTRERPDLLAVDRDGRLVVIELKRDDSGEDVHWQAIKYASYFSNDGADQIIKIFHEYGEPDAESRLLEHLYAKDLSGLNHDQRIILASHRFAPQVTSAALWLNEKATNKDLITCVQLTPYRDEADSLYLQASIIIPVPEIDVVGIDRDPKADDGVTRFVRKVEEMAKNGLPAEISPDKVNSRRRASDHKGSRYYHLWYRRAPWCDRSSATCTYYEVLLTPVDAADQAKRWEASVRFRHRRGSVEETSFVFRDICEAIRPIPEGWEEADSEIQADLGTDTLSEDFARKIAKVLHKLIVTITPVVDRLAKESG